MTAILKDKIYIWQQEDWPHFTWDSTALLEPLSRLSRMHGMLDGSMRMLGFGERSSSVLAAMTEDLVGSSGIEGVMLDHDSVRSSIARRLGIEDGALLPADRYVDGLVDVQIDALSACCEPLTQERFFGWHAALFPSGYSGMYRITVAGWREGEEPMQVVSGAFGHEKVHYQAPPSDRVPAEMERMMQWCASASESPFVMAAVAHLWFLTVHPFDDGNGRIGRTIADMFLARLDGGQPRFYSMSAEINRCKKEYYAELECAQKGSLDITRWMLWFFACLERAIARALECVELTLRKAEYWERFREVEVNERQRKVINRLWDGFEGRLTSSKWAKICHCSQDTALRDIKALLAAGMLRTGEGGGRSVHYVLA